MVVLSLCFSMLSMRAWDRLIMSIGDEVYTMLSMCAWDRLRTRTNAIYACMGQTTLSTLCNVDTHEAPRNRCFFYINKAFQNNNNQTKKPHLI